MEDFIDYLCLRAYRFSYRNSDRQFLFSQQVEEKPASSATEAEVVGITTVTDKVRLRSTYHVSLK